jgi:hypothetical protein
MMKEVLKAVGGGIGWGRKKGNVYTGLPLKFFEEKSYLERLAEWFTTAPHFLNAQWLSTH